MDKTDKAWINGYFAGYQSAKEEEFMNFETIGEAYAGKGATGKSYIRLHLDSRTASDVVYGDLCEKVYLFRSDKGNGQYEVMAPLKSK